MKVALNKKDQELAEAQKAALDKTKLAEEKLASVGKLEEEIANMKVVLDAANKEVSRLKNDKIALSDKASELVGKKNDLEAFLGLLAKKLFLMLEGNLSHPTDLLSSTRRRTASLSLTCVYKILPKFRGGDQSSGDRPGSHQLSCEGGRCHEHAPTGVTSRWCG